jgi:hypothetical protein
VAINGFVLLVATCHLRKSTGSLGKAVASGLLFGLTAAIISVFGSHRCDEGSAPLFIIVFAAVISAAAPWVFGSRPWRARGLIILIVCVGALSASHLASSYHGDDITGNPSYSSGRFWHTGFTGQYPRDRSKTPRFRRRDALSERAGDGGRERSDECR